MILKLKDESIADKNTPELWEDDVLSRKSVADLFIKIISAREEPITMCLNSAWGSGKTFFLTRLCEQYNRGDAGGKAGKAIYFNAWEDDNLDDPLLAIVGQLWTHLKGGTLKECTRAVTNATPALLKKTAFAAGLGLLKAVPVVGKVVEEVAKDATAEDLATPAENAVAEYEKMTEAKGDLIARLAELGQRVYDETKRPLLFIIDELDRCRPSFAIELLERIKHLFGVPHLVFLLGIDCKQLSQSVRAVYGDVDADNYLNRFFDIELNLPEPNNSHFLWMLNRKRYGQKVPSYTYLQDNLLPLSTLHKFSLRELEKVDRAITLMVDANLISDSENVILLPILVTLKMRNYPMYERLVGRKCEYAELIDALYGSAIDRQLFKESSNAIRYISQWYVQNHQRDPSLDPIYNAFQSIINANTMDGINTDVLPKLFLNAPFDLLKSCLKSAIEYRGWVNADESLPVVAAALGCVRHD